MIRGQINTLGIRPMFRFTIRDVLWLMVVVATLPLIANGDEKMDKREAFKRKMMPSVGKEVTVTGKLWTGKISEFIGTDDGGLVFIRATKSADVWRETELAKSSIGKALKMTGTLRFSPERPPSRPDVSGIDEHFYIDITEAIIRSAGAQER
jgi:hypothetical protein